MALSGAAGFACEIAVRHNLTSGGEKRGAYDKSETVVAQQKECSVHQLEEVLSRVAQRG
jgi:hypothetical protein